MKFGIAAFMDEKRTNPISRLFDHAVSTKDSVLVRKIWALSREDKWDFDLLIEGKELPYTPHQKTLDLVAEYRGVL